VRRPEPERTNDKRASTTRLSPWPEPSYCFTAYR